MWWIRMKNAGGFICRCRADTHQLSHTAAIAGACVRACVNDGDFCGRSRARETNSIPFAKCTPRSLRFSIFFVHRNRRARQQKTNIQRRRRTEIKPNTSSLIENTYFASRVASKISKKKAFNTRTTCQWYDCVDCDHPSSGRPTD